MVLSGKHSCKIFVKLFLCKFCNFRKHDLFHSFCLTQLFVVYVAQHKILFYSLQSVILFQNCRALFGEDRANYNLYEKLENKLLNIISKSRDCKRRVLYEAYLEEINEFKRKSKEENNFC